MSAIKTAHAIALALLIGAVATSDAQESETAKRLLLLGQGPDGHPETTHEYMAGVHILQSCLHDVNGLQIDVIQADGDWPEGPELIRKADGVVLFLSEGAKWLHGDPRRLEAFAQLAARGGGLSVLHWGMGTKEAKNIDGFVKLFGACHGGPDRKYKVIDAPLRFPHPDQAIAAGLKDFHAHDEFYYALKVVHVQQGFTPIMEAKIDDVWYPVAWAWQRGDGGRSFGFSGLHFHQNWRLPEYRRLVSQGVLWSVGLSVPERGLRLDLPDTTFALPPR